MTRAPDPVAASFVGAFGGVAGTASGVLCILVGLVPQTSSLAEPALTVLAATAFIGGPAFFIFGIPLSLRTCRLAEEDRSASSVYGVALLFGIVLGLSILAAILSIASLLLGNLVPFEHVLSGPDGPLAFVPMILGGGGHGLACAWWALKVRSRGTPE